MEIAIWGAGAVGIGLASALAGAGPPIRIIGRDPVTLRALSEHGIERSGLFGNLRVPPERLRIESDPTCLSVQPPDWLLVCTKAYASQEIAKALEAMPACLSASTRVVLCQNGWGNEAPFLSFWPTERLFHARVITGFRRRLPEQVEITAHASPIAMGSVFGHPTRGLEDLAERLIRGGIPAETRADMEAVLWAKMLYNCALNPLGALTDRCYGELAEQPATRALIGRVVAEIFEVLSRAGYRVAWTGAEAYLETFYAELIPPTAAHESSMLEDLRAGRPTEIEALCGAVERLAEEHGLQTPVVSALARLVRAAQSHEPG